MEEIKTKKTFRLVCILCNKEGFVNIYPEDLERYNNGALIQKAFPYLTPEERDFILLRWCPECYNREILPEEDPEQYFENNGK